MIEIAVTDTDGLLWYARSEFTRLGPEARRVYAATDKGRAAIGVPTITLVELADAERKGILHFPLGFAGWTQALFSSGRFFPLDLTLEIVVRSQALYGIPERTDRLIAATAAHFGYPLLTRDPEIGHAAGVEVVW